MKLVVLSPGGKDWAETVRKHSPKSWGTTRGRVNFFMNKFRKLRLIDYNGGIKVKPALLSVVLHA